MKMKKFIALLTVAGMTATMAVGCGSSSNETSDNAADTNTESSDSSLSGTITAAGSSALKPLADDAADSFLNLRVLRREGGNDGIVPLLRFQVKQIAQNAVPLVILQITDFIQTVHEAKADVLHRVLSADGDSEADHADLLVPMGQIPVFHNIHLINLLYACQGV